MRDMTYEHPAETIPVARAFVYGGDWVAACTRTEPDGSKACGNVEYLYVPSRLHGPRDMRRQFFLCSYCGMHADIDWPGQEHEILQVLSMRPVPGTRNWYPKDHPDAVNFHVPHGQTVRELLDENAEHGVH